VRLNGKAGFEVPAHGGIKLLAWSPDGSLLASAHGDRTVRLWDTLSGTPLEQSLVADFDVRIVSFEPLGTRVAVGGYSNHAWVWDLTGATARRRLELPPDCMGRIGNCGDLAWSLTGDLVATTACAEVRAFGGHDLVPLWTHSFLGAIESPLHAMPTVSGRVLFWGMLASHSQILSMEDGSRVADLSARELEILVESNGMLIAEGDSLVVLDATTLEERYRRIELADGHWLAFTPDGWCAGTTEGMHLGWAIDSGKPTRFEDLAPVLFDPKRLAAAAAVILVRPPTRRVK